MAPRKRRVSDISSQAINPKPSKRTSRRVSDYSGYNDTTRPTTTCHVSPTLGPTTRLGQPSLVTPHNSFYDLPRLVSFLSSEDPHHEQTLEIFPSTTTSQQPHQQLRGRVSPVETCPTETGDVSTPKNREEQHPVDVPVAPVPKTRHATHTTTTTTTKYDPNNVWGLTAVIAIALLFVCTNLLATPVQVIDDPGSIYVPGGGFSGFWYTLGRLNSIEDPLSKTYYCYSAGCLGAVTMLSNMTMEAAYGYASGAQKQWQRGELSRYDVAETFINGLLYGVADKGDVSADLRPVLQDPRILSTLRILTSERDLNHYGLKSAIRTPQTAQELKDMLLQTSWIPFAISRDLWHEQHMDGGFTLLEHPRCPTKLGYGFDWDIMLNSLNVDLDYDTVTLLWEKGLAQGLDP